jgi:hypothetical protein
MRENRRVLRFAVQEKLIPQALKDRGILESLMKITNRSDEEFSNLTEEENERLLLVSAFFADDEEGGVYYCI